MIATIEFLREHFDVLYRSFQLVGMLALAIVGGKAIGKILGGVG